MSTPIEICEEEWQDLKEEMSSPTPTTCAFVSDWVQKLQKFYRTNLSGYPMKKHDEKHKEERVFSPKHDVCCVYVPDDGYVPFSKAQDDVEITDSAANNRISTKRYLVTRVRFIFQSAYSLNVFAKTLPRPSYAFDTTTINLELQTFHSDVFPESNRDLREKARKHLAEWMEAMEALPLRLFLEVRLMIPSFHRGHFDLDRETNEFRSER